jgi:hypothetical protein
MSENKMIRISKLKLDLSNFRTVTQPDEVSAVNAMISISPDRFWALMESLLDSGYLPTENILVLKGIKASELVVKEGNRRVAALKLIFNLFPKDRIQLPENISNKIAVITKEWKKENSEIPCAVYENEDADTVEKIVNLTHGKGEKAGRDTWTAVAKARHNRNVNAASEPGLDILEKYLSASKKLTREQAERWAGDYPLTVLNEAIRKNVTRFGSVSAAELAKNYPKISYGAVFDEIILNVGLRLVSSRYVM